MIVSPFSQVRFIEVYVGDVLTSMVKTIVDLEYTICFYITGDFLLSQPQTCLYPNKYCTHTIPIKHNLTLSIRVLPPILSFLPLGWRMLQCLRVFVETKRVTGVWQWKHVANACKYLVGFGVIFFSALHENLYNLSYAGTSFPLFPSTCFIFPLTSFLLNRSRRWMGVR